MMNIFTKVIYFIRILRSVTSKSYSFYDDSTEIVFCVGDVNNKYLLNKYYSCVDANNVGELSWSQVFLNKIAFRKIKVDGLKAFFVKNLKLNYSKIVNLKEIVYFFFLRHSKDIMTVDWPYLLDVFSIVFPKYDIFLIPNKLDWLEEKLIYLFSKLMSIKDKTLGKVVFINISNKNILILFKLLHNNKKMIVRFHDALKSIFDDKDIAEMKIVLNGLLEKKIVNRLESYSKFDANLIGANYVPNAINKNICPKNKEAKKYLCCFVGTYGEKNNSRRHYMDALKKEINNLYGSWREYIYEYIIEEKAIKLSYKEYLEVISNCEIVLDFYRLYPEEGFSFRTSEAILMDKKIITNRTSVKDYDFYDPNKVFILEEDNIEMLGDFIRRTVSPYPDEIKRKYDNSFWWNDL